MMRSAVSAIICTVLTFSLSAVAVEQPVAFEKEISSLSSAGDLARWQHRAVNDGLLKWEPVVDRTTGRHAARVVTPTKYQVLYPGMNLPINDGEPANVSMYTEIVFDARGVNYDNILLQIVMLDENGVPQYEDFHLAREWQTYRAKLPRSFKDRKLAQIQFGFCEAPDPYEVYIANVRIANNDIRQPLDRIEAGIRDNGYQLSDELSNRLEQLSDQATALRAKADEASLGEWTAGALAFGRDVYQHQVDLQSQEFDRHVGNRSWGYAWADAATKVFRSDRVSNIHYADSGEIRLARNEYEAAQIVLRSHQDVKNVTVRVSDLAGDGGAIIAADHVQVMPVGFVNTKWPAYDTDFAGWHPDPLLDYIDRFDIDANTWQPVWIEVYAPADQPAGTYTGTITVTGDGAESFTAPLTVHVWNFAVPHEKHAATAVNHFDGTEVVSIFESQYARNEHADFTSYHKYLWHQLPYDAVKDNPTVQRLLGLRDRQNKVIADHRMNPRRIYSEVTPFNEEVQAVKDAGFNDYCILMIWSQRHLREGEPYPADLKKAYMDQLEEAVPRLKAAGLLEGAYVYGFDEANVNEFAAIKDMFGAIKERWPELRTMTTAYDYSYGLDTGLADVVDVWVPLTSYYGDTLPAIERARAAGEEIWWYFCLVPYPPYANLMIEQTGAEGRLLLGMMPFKYGAQGFLYYSLNYWKTGIEHVPFAARLNTGPLTNQDGRAWGMTNGDGLLFYAGDNGPVVTIRMKYVRDGLEDFEYLHLLKTRRDLAVAGEIIVPEGWVEQVDAALELPIVGSLTEFSKDGPSVLAVRNAIGELLSTSFDQAD